MKFLLLKTKPCIWYEVHFTKEAVLFENLDVKSLLEDRSKRRNIFTRETNTQNQTTKIHFSRNVKLDSHAKANLELNTLWNNTVLGGFSKLNIEQRELSETLYWFSSLFTLRNKATELNKISSNTIYEKIKKILFYKF